MSRRLSGTSKREQLREYSSAKELSLNVRGRAEQLTPAYILAAASSEPPQDAIAKQRS